MPDFQAQQGLLQHRSRDCLTWRAHIGRHGGKTFPGRPWERSTLLVLLLLAAILRFWDLPHIPYTHDEISGLVRTGYATFGELIEHGVAVDAHPPGVAVFLHYWTKLFGYCEGVVKAPFIVLSIAALFLLYRFAMAWTNGTVALVLTALLATIQYTVMYAQIARPYAAGFFTCALLADQWTRSLAGGTNAPRAAAGVAVAFALCAYMHHFALLFAGLVALTGLFLVQAAHRRTYLVACAAAVVAYLPNLPIFLRQLGYGGVGQWLAPPDRHWVPDYLAWVVQYDVLLGVVLSLLVLLSLVLRVVKGHAAGMVLWIGLFWGIAPLLIGAAWSIWVDPVLQYSVLIFSFPFLIVALLHGLPDMGRKGGGVVVTVAALGVVGLVRERRHYAVFYDSHYDAMMRESRALFASEGPANAAVLIDVPDEVVQFYMPLWRLGPDDFPYVPLRRRGYTVRLDSVLHTLRGRRTVLYVESSDAPAAQVARIQARFPTLAERRDMPGGQLFRFTDVPTGSEVKDREVIAVAYPDGRTDAAWDIHDDLPIVRDGRGASWDLTGREYGMAVDLLLDTVIAHPNDRIEVVADVSGVESEGDVAIVLELLQGDTNVFYSTGEARDQGAGPGRASLAVAAQRAYVKTTGPLVLRTYMHNRSKGTLVVHRFMVMRREGDRALYKTFFPLETPCAYRPGS